MQINFEGISAAEQVESKFVKPGAQTLTISGVELKTTPSGSNYLEVTFDSKEADASFRHPFWLSEKALSRLQYLIKQFSGSEVTGQLTVEAINAKLIGKSQWCLVDGETKTITKDGKTYNNTYPTLKYTGFAQSLNEKTFTDVMAVTLDKTTPTNQLETGSSFPTTNVDDDLPF